MFTKVYWIENFENGAALGIMPRPRGNDWLEDEIKSLKFERVQTVLSLLERQEINELGLKEEEAFCQYYQIDYINFPIKDRGLPADQNDVKNLILKLRQKLQQGEKVVIHCRMGIGRSSIIAGAILLNDHLTADEVIIKISKVRGMQIPDTDEQIDWLKNFK